MAAYSRAQLLLLLSSVCLCSFGSVLGLKAASGPAELHNPPVLRPADPPAKDAPAAAAAGASQPRRATGWKLSEEEACREDLTRLCPKHTWTNNLAVLECLQDRKEEIDIAPDCNHLLWNYKLNLTTDPKFESVAMEICKSTITEIKECNEVERGRGYLVSCLVDHRVNISEYQCNQYITKMTSIIFSDYRLICGFMDKCKEDINSLRCGSINIGHKDIHSQGEVIACLEKALVREVEQQDRAHPIKEECQKAILRVAELSSDDFHLDRHLYFSCRDDRERFCQNVRRHYRCLHDVHASGHPVSGECQGEMLDYRRMLMEDFSLSPEIVLHCRTEIEAQCSGLHRKGRTLHCLMRIGRGDRSNAMDSVCQNALQTLIQSADPGGDYRIDRALNEACESVIQTACKHIRNGDPMILSCLMEHLYTEKMVEDCEHRLLELQYFISRDWK
ncbi:Golgi apparatus protein 1b [Neolamprologus brichardi]|uniref:Golgi apparatus protein 1b n=1 Tax=Neolamprologus brichardi TaxID=32507 RepID=UPI0016438255|nr:Golgi apparatus protein 1b [Neolamprologus brichardi]